MTEPRLLSIEDAAECMAVSVDSVRNEIEAGRLPCVRIGSRKLVPQHDEHHIGLVRAYGTRDAQRGAGEDRRAPIGRFEALLPYRIARRSARNTQQANGSATGYLTKLDQHSICAPRCSGQSPRQDTSERYLASLQSVVVGRRLPDKLPDIRA